MLVVPMRLSDKHFTPKCLGVEDGRSYCYTKIILFDEHVIVTYANMPMRPFPFYQHVTGFQCLLCPVFKVDLKDGVGCVFLGSKPNVVLIRTVSKVEYFLERNSM